MRFYLYLLTSNTMYDIVYIKEVAYGYSNETWAA